MKDLNATQVSAVSGGAVMCKASDYSGVTFMAYLPGGGDYSGPQFLGAAGVVALGIQAWGYVFGFNASPLPQ